MSADFHTESCIEIQSHGEHQGVEQRNGIARRICNRLTEAEYCLIPLSYSSGYSAYRVVFGSNPVGLYERGADCEDLMFAQETSLPGQTA